PVLSAYLSFSLPRRPPTPPPFPTRRSSDLAPDRMGLPRAGGGATGLLPLGPPRRRLRAPATAPDPRRAHAYHAPRPSHLPPHRRSEEHTSELQSQSNLVCRLLLEKKKKQQQ